MREQLTPGPVEQVIGDAAKELSGLTGQKDVYTMQNRVAFVKRPGGKVLVKDLTKPDSSPVEFVDMGEG